MMKRVIKVVVVLSLILLMVVPLVGAQAPNIVDLAVADGRFNTLIAAVIAADLSDTLSGGEWTVFAPTDEAFARQGLNADNIATSFSQEELANILLYHVLQGNVSSGEAKTMLGDVTMANGRLAGLKFFDDSLWVNDDARVINADIVTSNGTVHVVDNLILPPWPRIGDEQPSLLPGEISEIPGDSIAGLTSRDGRFTTLLAGMVASGLVNDFRSGEWTLFAPTNEAFAKLGLDASNIADELSQQELSNLLLYQVLPGEHSTAQLKTMLGDVTMANGQLAGLKFFDDSIWVNDDSRVTEENIIADNGTIQVVDNVILPPWPRVEEPAEAMDSEAADEMSEEAAEEMAGEEMTDENS